MPLAGVVLAAGRSARMGSPKALLDFRGAPFVVRILEAFEALDLKARVVVLGPDAPRIRPIIASHDCLIVENLDVEGGPIASLRAALAALKPLRPAAALVWPVDLPHVRITTVERLIEAWSRGKPPAVVPVFGERRGHPVIWDAALFGELESSRAAAAGGARAVLHAHAPQVAAVTVDDPAVIDDLNTPEDYERLVREVNRDAY
jgi:molybdenum cofactor cytidylyltransferase